MRIHEEERDKGKDHLLEKDLNRRNFTLCKELIKLIRGEGAGNQTHPLADDMHAGSQLRAAGTAHQSGGALLRSGIQGTNIEEWIHKCHWLGREKSERQNWARKQ